MKKFVLFILFIAYNIASLFGAAAAPADEQIPRLFVLSNVTCTVSLMCGADSIAESDILTLTAEPGKSFIITLQKEKPLLLFGISIQPHRNVVAENTRLSENRSLPEYGKLFKQPQTVGEEPLSVIINELYNVVGYTPGAGVYQTHSINLTLRNTEKPTNEPLLSTQLTLENTHEEQ